tara:strand:+ start:12143 stop:13804 length:1662 start_codon:yes stop_codon:yes gene_type:complete
MKLLMVENILSEGIPEKVQKKYGLTNGEMMVLGMMDPTPTKKLLEWITKHYVEDMRNTNGYPSSGEAEKQSFTSGFHAKHHSVIESWFENIEKKKDNPDFIKDLAELLGNPNHPIVKSPADINVYDGLYVLRRITEFAEAFMSKSDIKKQSIKKKIGNYLIVVPETEAASCYYGAGTKWCTAARKANMFKNYAKDAIIFYVINLTKEEGEPLQKIAALKYFKDKDVHGLRIGDYTLWNAADKKLDNLEPEDIFPKAVVQWMNQYWTNKVKLDTPLSVEKKTALILPELEAMEGAHMDYTIGKGWEFHIEDDMGGWFATFAKEMPPEGFYIVYATPFYDGADFVPVDMQDPEGDQISYDTIKLPQVTTGDAEPGKKLSQAYFERVGRMIKKMATEEGIHDHQWDKVDADTEVCDKCGLRRSLSDTPYPDSKNVMGSMTRKDYAGLGDDYLLSVAKEEGIGDWNDIENKLSPGFNRTQLLNDLADQSGDMARHKEPINYHGNKAEWMNWYDRMGSRDMKALEKEYMKATNMSTTDGRDRDEMIQGIMQSSRHNKR